MTFDEVKSQYWKYYISLEEQFMETERYVEFDYVNNGKTYSIEYLKLFQAVCSEIDVVGKVLAGELDNNFRATKYTGINEWWYTIIQGDATLIEHKCTLFDGHVLQPWESFIVVENEHAGAKRYILAANAKTPSWWNAYNSVKHNRTGRYERHSTNFAKANLRNLFYAFSALYSLEVKLMELVQLGRNDTTQMESKLFKEDLLFYVYHLVV